MAFTLEEIRIKAREGHYTFSDINMLQNNRKLYRDKVNEKEQEFVRDCVEALGIPFGGEKVVRYAWQESHSAGFYAVVNTLIELVPVVEAMVNPLREQVMKAFFEGTYLDAEYASVADWKKSKACKKIYGEVS